MVTLGQAESEILNVPGHPACRATRRLADRMCTIAAPVAPVAPIAPLEPVDPIAP